MPSQKLTLASNTWVDVSQGFAEGSITHFSGAADILFTQQAAIPTGDNALSEPIQAVMEPLGGNSREQLFFGGLNSERIYGYSQGSTSVLVVTNVEG